MRKCALIQVAASLLKPAARQRRIVAWRVKKKWSTKNIVRRQKKKRAHIATINLKVLKEKSIARDNALSKRKGKEIRIETMSEINPNVFINAARIGVDSETKDPHLRTMGAGCWRNDGYVVGWSFATKDVAAYYPIKHPDTTPEEAARNEKIVQAILKAHNEKVFANGLYDRDWANSYGWVINGQCHDIQIAEPLLNEYRPSYSLAALAKTYSKEAKATEFLEKYCSAQGWSMTKETPAVSYIWRMPASAAEHYAKLDGTLALQIFEEQKILLEEENLYDLYLLEMKLMPLLLRMRKQGVRLDMPKLKHTASMVADEHFKLSEKLFELAGKEFNIKSTAQLAGVFDKLGIDYPRNEPTPLMREAGKPGNPNLDKDSLNKIKETSSTARELCQAILDYRHYDTLINMFFIPYLEMQHRGRLHCSFNPLRSDEYGTVSGRFSSSKPNLQQVPAMADKLDLDEADEALKGQIIRKLFIPEEDHLWGKADYSQIEYRIMAHYAIGPGAEELREDYRTNPNADHHKRIQDKTGFDRRTAKRLNFGGSYGMGVKTAAAKFGWTLEEAEMFMASYHAASPYLKPTRAKVIQTAERRGYIFTILGRKARVDYSRKLTSFFNRLIQGSAADIMKKAMVDCWEAGIYDVLIPHLTVHDEMDVSIPHTKEGEEAWAEQQRLMENAVQLSVPLRVDCHTGSNWAEAD